MFREVDGSLEESLDGLRGVDLQRTLISNAIRWCSRLLANHAQQPRLRNSTTNCKAIVEQQGLMTLHKLLIRSQVKSSGKKVIIILFLDCLSHQGCRFPPYLKIKQLGPSG